MHQMSRKIYLNISGGSSINLLVITKIHEIHRVGIGICSKLSTYIHKQHESYRRSTPNMILPLSIMKLLAVKVVNHLHISTVTFKENVGSLKSAMESFD